MQETSSTRGVRRIATLLAGVIIVAGLGVSSPAMARAGSADSTSVARVAAHPVNKLDRPDLRVDYIRAIKSASFWEGGCHDMFGRCIFMNRDAQKVVATGSFAGLGVVLCTVVPVVGCVLASILLAVAYELISQRGGICGGNSNTGPWYRPNLEVRYTWIHSAQCTW